MAFINTVPGAISYFVSFASALTGYLMVLHLSPPLFGGPNPQGVHLGDDVGRLIFDLPLEVKIAIPMISIVILLWTGSFSHLLRVYDWPFQFSFPTFTGILIYIITFLSLFALDLLHNSRGALEFPGSFYIFSIFHLFFIVLLTLDYMACFLPDEFNGDEGQRIYFEYQWRLGRLVVAITLTLIAGLTIPLVIQLRDAFPALGLIYLWSSFLPPLVAIGFLSFLRAKEMERQIRTNGTDESKSDEAFLRRFRG